MNDGEPTVFIVDDDSSVRESLGSLIRSVGLRVQSFGSAQEFLQSSLNEALGCMVLDVRLPGLSGLELQQQLADAGVRIPIIFLTGYADVPMSVQAMKSGAAEFLTKPFRDQELLDSIHKAIERHRITQRESAELARIRERFETLTPREREVMKLVVSGLLNKQIAADLGTSEITVKVHRAQAMHKMQAASLPDLVRMAEKLEIPVVK